jgi:hypothetical protein
MTLTGPRVDLLLGGAWTNVTSFVATDEKITIRRGRSSETGSAENSSATLTLINNDLRFSPRYPSGPYFGQFTRNTPIRIGIGTPPAGTSALWASSGALQAPAVNAEASGTVLSCWAQNDSAAAITGPTGYTMQGTQTGASVAGLATNAGYKTGISAGTVAAVAATSTKTAAGAALSLFIPGATAVAATAEKIRTFNVFNTPNPDFPSDWLADTVTAGDVCVVLVAWSSDARNAMLQAPMDNSQRADWCLVADSGPSAGARVQAWARYCPVGETIKLNPVCEVYGQSDRSYHYFRLTGATAYQPRFAGYCSEIVPGSTSFGRDLRTAVTCGSALRVYTQGTPAAQSNFYRYLTDRTPIAYWPLESGTQGTSYASPIAGVLPAIVGGASGGTDSASFPTSGALVQLSENGFVTGLIPAVAAASNQSGSASVLTYLNGDPGSGTVPPEDGDIFAVTFAATSGSSTSIAAIGVAGIQNQAVFVVVFGDGSTSNLNYSGAFSGVIVNLLQPLGIAISWAPNGTNPTTKTDITIKCAPASGGPELSNGVYTVTATAGRATSLTAGPILSGTNANALLTVGHMAYSNRGTVTDYGNGGLYPNTYAFTEMVRGWNREDVVVRMLRLAQEDSVPLSLPAVVDGTVNSANQNVWHGPQPIATGPDLFTLAQATDGGELAEARGFAGLLYRPLAALCSQAVSQTFDYSTPGYIGAPFTPADDDTLIRNDVTASQTNGSSARAYQATGALGINPPPSGVGQYVTSVTVDTSQQGRDLPNIASWNLALGTIDAERFKAVTSVLEAIPAAAAALMAVDIGQHVQTANTPAWVQPGPADHLVIGTTEVIGALNEQSITYALRPFGTFAVVRLNDSTFGKLNSGNHLGLNGGM